ncbi:MAG: ABC transporter permease, partial [bacterium]
MAERSVEWEARVPAGRRLGTAALVVRMVRRRRVIAVGAAILLLILAAAAAAGWLAPYDPLALNVPERLRPPGRTHLFGTDEFGRDIFSRVVFGARLSLLVGVLVTVLAVSVGIVIGLITGSSPRVDRVLMRIMDGLMAFP